MIGYDSLIIIYIKLFYGKYYVYCDFFFYLNGEEIFVGIFNGFVL